FADTVGPRLVRGKLHTAVDQPAHDAGRMTLSRRYLTQVSHNFPANRARRRVISFPLGSINNVVGGILAESRLSGCANTGPLHGRPRSVSGHQVVETWVANFAQTGLDGRTTHRELDAQSREFWQLFLNAAASGDAGSLQGSAWEDTRHFLEELSRERVLKGFSAAETASFVFSLKRPL